jgi:hypothetical protein
VRARLVTRSRSTNSNREVTVGLTAAAAKLVARLIPIARQLERDATAGLSAAELQMTKQSLRHMYDNLAGRAQINGASMLRRARRAPKAAPRGGEAAGAAVQRRS